MRVIVISSPQRGVEAEKFAQHFKDKFKGYYVFSGVYHTNGEGYLYPKYFVVRLPEKDEEEIYGHEMEVGPEELLEKIADYRVKENCAT